MSVGNQGVFAGGFCGINRPPSHFAEEVPAKRPNKSFGLIDELIHGGAILKRELAGIL